MSRIPEQAFRRYDETPDEEFYETPRLVTHIDDRVVAAVMQLYREFLPPDGEILDLMSSWVSHLPEEVRYSRVVGFPCGQRGCPSPPPARAEGSGGELSRCVGLEDDPGGSAFHC